MRKFLCMLMAVLVILMCAGCGGPKGETLSGDSGPEDEAGPALNRHLTML